MWLMYLVLMLDNFIGAFLTAAIIIALLLGIIRFVRFVKYDDRWHKEEEDFKAYKKFCKELRKWWVIPIILFITCTFMPSTHTAAALYVLPKIIANKQVRKMPDKLVTLANSWMDEQIKSIKTK